MAASDRVGTPAAPNPNRLESAIVAHRYYIDGKQKSEIAEELGMSRFRVARLLQDARAEGIVTITVAIPADLDLALGDAVARRFGVSRVLAVESIAGAPELTGARIGTAGADYLASVLAEDDVLGMSWGQSITRVVDAVRALPAVDIVQLVGGANAIGMNVSGSELVRRLSEKSGGRAFPLHAPLLVRSAGMATALKTDPSLSDVIHRFADVTVALVGIGSWNPPHSALHEAVTPAEVDELRAAGVEADVCALFLDHAGRFIDSPVNERRIGISVDELRAARHVVAVAADPTKSRAIVAALRSGIVTALVTDSETAAAMLELPEDA